MRKLAKDLRAGDVIMCRGEGWYRVGSIIDEGSTLYVMGDSDECDDDLPLMLRPGQMVMLE